MPNVNDNGLLHASFIENYPGGRFPEVRFWPYGGGGTRKILEQAMNILQKNVYKKNSSCNTYFAHLSGGKSFDSIWEDPAFFINWDPRVEVAFWGFQSSTRPKEITVSEETFTKGAWFVAAIIVHEMAHVAGAPGGTSDAAERSLKACGFNQFFDASRIGDTRDYANVRLKERYA